MSKVQPGLKYSREHEWVRSEGDLAVVGITDHAQAALGDIVFVDLPKVGSEVKFMRGAGSVESVKAASDIYTPLSGKIVEVNKALDKTPDQVNLDCYGAGWIFKIAPSQPCRAERTDGRCRLFGLLGHP